MSGLPLPLRLVILTLSLFLLSVGATAQPVADASGAAERAAAATQTPASPSAAASGDFDNRRPPNQSGLNVFEPAKVDSRLMGRTPEVRLGGAFTQQFQGLSHENTATPAVNPQGVNTNQLMEIGGGFNLATANLDVNALLADGIQVDLVTYLSSRHHQDAWVKGGYLQVDAAKFLGVDAIDKIMELVTVKLGHFEINYGDAHFRRTDNGSAIYNPFIGNNIMDAFATEIGGEVYVRKAGALAMVGITNGEINGSVTAPDGRSYSVFGKVGIDRQVTNDLRVRLTASGYGNNNAGRNTLYQGDRTGSRFYMVMENTAASTSANFTSGRISPGFTEQVMSIMVNPFVKFQGLELFGTFEQTSGRAGNEADTIDRSWTQFAVDGVYRFLPREQVFVGARYNTVSGPLAGPVAGGQITTAGQEISINRMEIGAGWFPTPNLVLKGSYVQQNYNDFLPADIRNGGKFNGFMIEGALAF